MARKKSGGNRRPGTRGSAPAAGGTERRVPKRPTNLTLDPDAIARGERFGNRHGASLSQLVNRFLHALPESADSREIPELDPAVRRLYGVARGTRRGREAYRAHLEAKYGSRD
jgi:hypothetical protein